MIIRPATKNDLATCEKLALIPEFITPSGHHIDIKFLENYLDPNYFLVVENNNQIIGFAIGEPLKGKGFMLLYLTIKKGMQGKGIGKKLLKELENRCKKQGVRWIVLYGPAFNKGTITFYKKTGYYSQEKALFEFGKRF